ncbi:uncharacterized protein LOC108734916 isoform X1 [Agrilus planipennis]|uniref:Uncharacterized protein LOC108734916 isoform X1 n=1 Tax=Agrilus planipennis TaxID=224129 RepID=A0A7F5R892_AGRPL|nr:uncharacterized protein LOC108734916 isoform X1 [Agrilus planipennis]
MQFVESVVYLGILCIHYPLKITLATSRTAKELVEKGINVHKQVSSNVNTTVAKQYQTLNDYLSSIKEYILNVPNTVRSLVYSFIPFGLANGSSQQEPKNQYEKTFLKFQVAAFEKERVEYQKEIRRLQDELQRTQNKSNNFDKEKQKYEKQIKTLEENLAATNARFQQLFKFSFLLITIGSLSCLSMYSVASFHNV